MKKNNTLEDIVLPFLLIIITWQSVAPWMKFHFSYTWFIDWMANMGLVFIFFMSYWKERKKTIMVFPKSLFFLVLVLTCSLFYGIFYMADDYFDTVAGIKHYAQWMLCMGVLYFQNPYKLSHITALWVKYAVPIAIILVPLMTGEAVGKYFAPFTFIICFFPYLKGRARIISIIIIMVVLVCGALGARSVLLRFTMAILIAFGIYFQSFFSKFFLSSLSVVLLLTPFIFITLAITTDFNIFQIQEYFGLKDVEVASGTDEKGSTSGVFQDTRTLLYTEVILSAVENDYVVFGRSLSRGNDSYSKLFLEEDVTNSHYERRANEVRILNVFTYMGIVGVIVFFLLHVTAVYTAFRKGRSIIIYFMGAFVAARWVFAWMEDFERFDLNNLFLWIPIAMCFSPMFLNMTDSDFKNWAKTLVG